MKMEITRHFVKSKKGLAVQLCGRALAQHVQELGFNAQHHVEKNEDAKK